MAKEGRKAADIIAGEQIIFHNDKSKVKEAVGMVAPDQKIIAPLFNLVSCHFPFVLMFSLTEIAASGG
jgi:hypothetical protein